MFTIGADPEIFVKRKGLAFSAHGLIPGTKKEPFPVQNGAVQIDGTALEFNINPTNSNDFEGFNHNVTSVMAQLSKMVKERDPSITLNLSSVQDFDEGYLASLPDETKELGCEPDYCAYTLKENPRPDNTAPFRTAAGHIHIGWGTDIPVENEEHVDICADFVKMCDATVGLFMTCLDREPRRRELYGKAGAFRPKSYGVEYRTPSNAWLGHKDYRRAVHTLLQLAIDHKVRGETVLQATGFYEARIQEIINSGQHENARSLLMGMRVTSFANFDFLGLMDRIEKSYAK